VQLHSYQHPQIPHCGCGAAALQLLLLGWGLEQQGQLGSLEMLLLLLLAALVCLEVLV
jgi:hypothetical protein